MDNGTIDREGLSGISDLLLAIDGIDSRADLTATTIVLLEQGFSPPAYYYWAGVNPPEDSTEVVPALYQGGLGLPDRDYYLRNDIGSVELQDAYREHIARVLMLAGETAGRAATDAETVYAMEKALAAAHLGAEENRDPQKTTNIYTLAELEEEFPAIGWGTLAAIPGSGPVGEVHVYQPGYVEGLDSLLATAPLKDWKVYLRYRLIDQASPYLGGASFEEEHFAFYKTTLYGVPEMKPPVAACRQYGERTPRRPGGPGVRRPVRRPPDPGYGIGGDGRCHPRDLRRTDSGPRLDERAHEAAAHEKLAAMGGEKIAYPDQWTDYSGLNLSDSYVANVRAAKAHSFIHGPEGLEKVGGPVDRSIWFVPPRRR